MFMEHELKLLPYCLKSHKNVNRNQRCKKKNVFHIACQLASAGFFLGLLSTLLFHPVLGITRDETSSALLWKLFCTPSKSL